MRELRTLLIYLTGAVSLVLGILAAGHWALTGYSRFPGEAETHTTAVASKVELADETTTANNPLRQPIWIEPTRKYTYTPAQVVIVKPNPAPPVMPMAPATMPRSQAKAAAKPARPRVAINSEARRAYATGGQVQELLMLPLQHQAPH